MAQSNSYNYKATRNDIITRALRLCGAIPQGGTPNTTALNEAIQALNDLVKEWEADGMPLWKVTTCSPITMVSGQTSYTIGLGAGTDINQLAPLKIFNAWLRNTTSETDQPLNIITKDFYDSLSSKVQPGTPSQLYYATPGGIAASEMQGTIYLFITPDAIAASTYSLYFTGQYPFMDFDAANDVPDFPSYFYNALVWGLADQLSYEYGLGATEKSQINKKALYHKDQALSFGSEEGSMFIQPKYHLPNP